MDSRLLAFIGVAALLTIAPGPDMALVLRNALRGGRAAVLPTAAGICTGCIVWGGASSLGVAALLATSAQLYEGLKLAGAVYLIVLGVLALRAAFRCAIFTSIRLRSRSLIFAIRSSAEIPRKLSVALKAAAFF